MTKTVGVQGCVNTQLSSVQGGVYALGNDHMRSTLSLSEVSDNNNYNDYCHYYSPASVIMWARGVYIKNKLDQD